MVVKMIARKKKNKRANIEKLFSEWYHQFSLSWFCIILHLEIRCIGNVYQRTLFHDFFIASKKESDVCNLFLKKNLFLTKFFRTKDF